MTLFIFLICVTPFSAEKVEIIKEGDTRLIHLIKDVVIKNNNIEIKCMEAVLNETEGWVKLKDSVRIVEADGVVTAGNAIYYFKKRVGYLNNNVILKREKKVISADSLFYNGKDEFVKMYSSVVIEDEVNNLKAYGSKGYYNLKDDIGYLTDNPRLEVFREDTTPIIVTAKKFQIIADSNLFYGFDSVVARIDSITIYCDTFSYNLEKETGQMVNPLVSEKNNVLKGIRGRFWLSHKKISLFEVEEGWSRYYNKSGSKNVVEGERINITFKEGKARIIKVNGGPRGVLTLKEKTEDAGD